MAVTQGPGPGGSPAGRALLRQGPRVVAGDCPWCRSTTWRRTWRRAFLEGEVADSVRRPGGLRRPHRACTGASGGGSTASLGQTLDDAAGEAFDKVAKLLGLGYPGGVVSTGWPGTATPGPVLVPPADAALRATWISPSPGLKTALRTHCEAVPRRVGRRRTARTPARRSRRPWWTRWWRKTFRAAERDGVACVVACGGVACNSRLRERLAEEAGRRGLRLVIPRPRLCTDNAVMVAGAGRHRFLAGVRAGLDLNAIPTWPLGGPA